jgi:Na+/proline symporter
MDLTVVLIVGMYFIGSLGLGLWVARKEKDNTDEYFLAGRKVPWYAVAMSMTGSNIGTEHFIGFVGAAYVFGMAPAVWEWGNFIAYSVLIWIFLPFYFHLDISAVLLSQKTLYHFPVSRTEVLVCDARDICRGATVDDGAWGPCPSVVSRRKNSL